MHASHVSFLSRSKSISSFRINPLTNKWMVGGVLLSFCFLILGIYVPGVNTLFDNVYFQCAIVSLPPRSPR